MIHKQIHIDMYYGVEQIFNIIKIKIKKEINGII